MLDCDIRTEMRLIGIDKVDGEVEVVETEAVKRETHFGSMLVDELETMKANARIGYLSINLYDPPPEATWGVYNDRKINDSWVQHLYNDFQRRHDNCTEEDCLEVAIKPEWLEDRAQVRVNEIWRGRDWLNEDV